MDSENDYSSSSSSSSSTSDHEDYSDAQRPIQRTTGLRLVIPSLSSLKSANREHQGGQHQQQYQSELHYQQQQDDIQTQERLAGTSLQKKSKPRKKLYFTSSTTSSSKRKKDPDAAKKAPRPAKLKPLKEVLTKLISQIKKKDDYAFFLEPVDIKQVPGYTNVVKRPMDLGTISTKVARGRYRSLEEFTSDFRLVTGNAKLFNPLGSIHYAEAERIEAYGLDHIAKATTTVIQYETDWNIDIEHDEDQSLKAEDDGQDTMMVDDFAPTSAVGDDSRHGSRYGSPAMSVAGPSSAVLGSSTPVPLRRGGNRLLRQTVPAPATFAAVGTSHSKKEKEGTPLAKTISESLDENGRMPGVKDGLTAFPPGSDWAKVVLDIKLRKRVPKTKKERLRLEKVGSVFHNDGSLAFTEMKDPFSILSFFIPEPLSKPVLHHLYTSTPQPTEAPPSFLPAITLPPEFVHMSPPSTPAPPALPAFQTLAQSQQQQYKHWSISRNPNRQRAQDKDRDQKKEPEQITQVITSSREVSHLDFGSFAVLAAELDAEMRKRGIELLNASGSSSVPSASATTSSALGTTIKGNCKETDIPESDKYWKAKAIDAERHLRDLVYGGASGFAYARSLAEFLNVDPELRTYTSKSPTSGARSLDGLTLPEYVVQKVLDPLTEGRHAILRETAALLAFHFPYVDSQQRDIKSSFPSTASQSALAQIIQQLLRGRLEASRALEQLISMRNEQVDMCALVKSPEELFISEEEWVGKKYLNPDNTGVVALDHHLLPWPTDNIDATDVDTAIQQALLAGGDVLGYTLKCTSDAIEKLILKHQLSDIVKTEDTEGGEGESDVILRHLRLNLLALAKRAPLEKVTMLPMDLIPEHIRMHVPLLGPS